MTSNHPQHGDVALRKESVDRNKECITIITTCTASLSARRAWIEIANFCRNRFCPTVALRKESVDRNNTSQRVKQPWGASLSARRAWIEIVAGTRYDRPPLVALRKESVDRNVPGKNLVNGI